METQDQGEAVKLELNLVKDATNKGCNRNNMGSYINQKRNAIEGVTSSSPNKQGWKNGSKEWDKDWSTQQHFFLSQSLKFYFYPNHEDSFVSILISM